MPGKKLSQPKEGEYTQIAKSEMQNVRAIGSNAARILRESKMIREANKNSLAKIKFKYNEEIEVDTEKEPIKRQQNFEYTKASKESSKNLLEELIKDTNIEQHANGVTSKERLFTFPEDIVDINDSMIGKLKHSKHSL